MEKQIENFVKNILTNKTKNTVEAYRRDIEKFALYLQNKGIQDFESLSDVDLIMYFANLEKEGNSKNSIVRYVAAIKAFFDYLYKEGLIKKQINLKEYNPKAEKKERDILTKKEFEKLISNMNTDKVLELRDKALILLMYYYGLKPTCIVDIKVNDIDLNLGVGVVNNKTISLNKEILPFIKDYIMLARSEIMKDCESDYLFLGYGETRLTRQSVWKILNKYRQKSEIDKEITSNTLHDSYRYHRVLES